MHYDQYGFGNGFELSKPQLHGRFSSPVDLAKGHKYEDELLKRKKKKPKNNIMERLEKI